MVAAGLPFVILALLFGAIGVAILVVTKDSVAYSLASAIGNRRSRKQS